MRGNSEQMGCSLRCLSLFLIWARFLDQYTCSSMGTINDPTHYYKSKNRAQIKKSDRQRSEHPICTATFDPLNSAFCGIAQLVYFNWEILFRESVSFSEFPRICWEINRREKETDSLNNISQLKYTSCAIPLENMAFEPHFGFGPLSRLL
jgi:hypothetical protein